MDSTSKQVNPIELLENYRSDTQTIAILQHALESVPRASANEVIESMNFAHGEGIGTVTGRISDKTAYIAFHYQQKTDSINTGSYGRYVSQLWRMEQEREHLNFYVSLLEPRQRKVIELYYMQGISRESTASELSNLPQDP